MSAPFRGLVKNGGWRTTPPYPSLRNICGGLFRERKKTREVEWHSRGIPFQPLPFNMEEKWIVGHGA